LPFHPDSVLSAACACEKDQDLVEHPHADLTDKLSIAGLHYVIFDMFPDGAGAETVAYEITIYLIMTKSLTVICKMSQRIVNRRAE
jgi:hypothetical protein